MGVETNRYPLITLSTRAQVESRRGESAFLTAVRRIVAQEGVPGLYAGLDSAVFGISVTNFVYYYWYEWTRSFFQRAAAASNRPGTAGRAAAHIRLTTVESMIAGAIAGSATVILTNPIWVVNTRMTTRAQQQQQQKQADDKKEPISMTDDAAADTAEQEGKIEGAADEEKKPIEPPPTTATATDEATKKKKRPSTIGTLLALLREEGPQALFRGVVPALVLVINPILQYTLFEQMKNVVERRQRLVGKGSRGITPSTAFFLGALGKLFATAVTYPYITVKSRMHVADHRDGERREGVFGALSRVVHEEGYAGLYKGKSFSPPSPFASLFGVEMPSGSRAPRLNFIHSIPSSTNPNVCLYRHRTQDHPERPDRRLPLRLQGRPVRADRAAPRPRRPEGPHAVSAGAGLEGGGVGGKGGSGHTTWGLFSGPS